MDRKQGLGSVFSFLDMSKFTLYLQGINKFMLE